MRVSILLLALACVCGPSLTTGVSAVSMRRHMQLDSSLSLKPVAEGSKVSAAAVPVAVPVQVKSAAKLKAKAARKRARNDADAEIDAPGDSLALDSPLLSASSTGLSAVSSSAPPPLERWGRIGGDKDSITRPDMQQVDGPLQRSPGMHLSGQDAADLKNKIHPEEEVKRQTRIGLNEQEQKALSMQLYPDQLHRVDAQRVSEAGALKNELYPEEALLRSNALSGEQRLPEEKAAAESSASTVPVPVPGLVRSDRIGGKASIARLDNNLLNEEGMALDSTLPPLHRSERINKVAATSTGPAQALALALAL